MTLASKTFEVAFSGGRGRTRSGATLKCTALLGERPRGCPCVKVKALMSLHFSPPLLPLSCAGAEPGV